MQPRQALLTLSLNYQALIVNREWEQPGKCLAGSVPKYCFPGRESRTICLKLAVSQSEELWRHPCSNCSAPTANFRPVKSGWCLMAAVAVCLAMRSFLNPSSQPGIATHSSFPDELKRKRGCWVGLGFVEGVRSRPWEGFRRHCLSSDYFLRR